MLNEARKRRMPWRSAVIAMLTGWCFAAPALAGKADVVDAQAVRDSDGSYRFKVLLRSGDQEWGHYANSWEVVAPDGTVLGTTILLHPHEQDQPFARYVSKVIIPDGITKATIRAIDIKHGGSGKKMTVKVPR
jgi:hypothetical protein